VFVWGGRGVSVKSWKERGENGMERENGKSIGKHFQAGIRSDALKKKGKKG